MITAQLYSVATDNVGLKATAFSDHVTYDSSPPLVDWLRVGSVHRHLTYVSDNDITVHWGGARDNHSGVRMTQIGIGRTAHAPDIMEYQVVYGLSFHLDATDVLNNGLAYFFLRVSVYDLMQMTLLRNKYNDSCRLLLFYELIV